MIVEVHFRIRKLVIYRICPAFREKLGPIKFYKLFLYHAHHIAGRGHGLGYAEKDHFIPVFLKSGCHFQRPVIGDGGRFRRLMHFFRPGIDLVGADLFPVAVALHIQHDVQGQNADLIFL